MTIPDHPQRRRLTNEMHARPFPKLAPTGQMAFFALKEQDNAVSRDRSSDLADYLGLLDHYGLRHPDGPVSHDFVELPDGRALKWEQHTEIATYTLYRNHPPAQPFDPGLFAAFPDAWGAGLTGARLTSVLIDIYPMPSEAEIDQFLARQFSADALAVSFVLDEAALIAGDFTIDPAGHLRFAIFVRDGTGRQRIGRIAQRLCEIETYKALSLLGFARAKSIAPQLVELETRLARLSEMVQRGDGVDETLDRLLTVSGELEHLISASQFRFSATEAYEAIVQQRLSFLRQTRFGGRQTFSEFLLRRYDPAIRTAASTRRRGLDLAQRATRTADLLRTRVDVARSAQSQALLQSMDRRADMQLQLQKTVEGLSVVAISYYAASLVSYVLYPLASRLGIDKGMLLGAVTLPVIAVVWWVVHRIRTRH